VNTAWLGWGERQMERPSDMCNAAIWFQILLVEVVSNLHDSHALQNEILIQVLQVVRPLLVTGMIKHALASVVVLSAPAPRARRSLDDARSTSRSFLLGAMRRPGM